MSSFKSIDLFGSGPHRFTQSPQGETVVPNYILGGSESGSSPVGPLELDIMVTGRLIAASESALWTLRDAITAQLADPPVPGTLIDSHAHSWENMSFIAYAEPHPTDRGRVFSVEYKATFPVSTFEAPPSGKGWGWVRIGSPSQREGAGGWVRFALFNAITAFDKKQALFRLPHSALRVSPEAPMDPDITISIAQFGAAGLMGWMWLTERRSAAARERELSEAHDKLMQERRSLDLLLGAMQESTRVLTAIEIGQRHLAALLDRIAPGLHPPAPPA